MTTNPAEQRSHENPYRAEPMIDQRDQKPLREEDRLPWKRVARGMRWMLVGSLAFVISAFGGFSTLAWVVVSSSETNYEEDAYYGVIEFLTLFLSFSSALMVCFGIALCLYTPKQVNSRWFVGRSLVIVMTLWSILFSDWVGGEWITSLLGPFPNSPAITPRVICELISFTLLFWAFHSLIRFLYAIALYLEQKTLLYLAHDLFLRTERIAWMLLGLIASPIILIPFRGPLAVIALVILLVFLVVTVLITFIKFCLFLKRLASALGDAGALSSSSTS